MLELLLPPSPVRCIPGRSTTLCSLGFTRSGSGVAAKDSHAATEPPEREDSPDRPRQPRHPYRAAVPQGNAAPFPGGCRRRARHSCHRRLYIVDTSLMDAIAFPSCEGKRTFWPELWRFWLWLLRVPAMPQRRWGDRMPSAWRSTCITRLVASRSTG